MGQRLIAAAIGGTILGMTGLVQAGTAHFTITEVTSGTWDVFVAVDGSDTSGLVSYNIQLVDLAPGENESVAWSQNVLGNLEEGTFVSRGFQTDDLTQGKVGSTEYSAVNSQFGKSNPIYDIGMTPIFVEGADAVGSPDVDLDVPALLGTLTTPDGLTATNFAPNANLFDNSQTSTGLLTAGNVTVTQTVTPIPEPASVTLLAVAGLALMGIRRRRIR